MIRIPDDLTRTISTWAGEAGSEWLARLPRLVGEIADEWGLTLGEPYQPSGYASLAVRAGEYVLKVQYPDEWSAQEGEALRHYDGDGAVAIHREDTGRRALLLERCDPGTPLLQEDDDTATRVVAELLTRLWRPPAQEFRRLNDALPRWAETIARSRLDARLRDEAVEATTWLAATTDETVLHGDLHPGNVLRASRRPWLAIDPKPKAGDRAYDLASVLRDRAAPAVVPRRFAIVSEVSGLDPRRIRAWALVKAAEGAAWSYDVGDDVSGDAFTRAAECIRAL